MPERPRRERPERERVAAPRTGTASSRQHRTRAGASRQARVVLPKRREAAPKKASRPRRPAKRPTGAKRPASPKVRRRRSVVVTLLLGLLLLAFLFAFVYPTRTYLKQRDQIQASQERLGILERETNALARDTKRLGGDAEVERIAREQYGLVRPGETPYVLVPETTATTTPTTAPAGK
jgi:cell division protein FtsB